MNVRTKSVARLLLSLFILGLVLILIYHFYLMVTVPDSLLLYYWLPREQYLVAAYDLYLRYQYSMMARPVPLSLSILVFTLAMFTRIFNILSKNFESFGEAWGAFKAFTRKCYKKNRLMLSALLAPPLLGASIGIYLLALPYGPRLMVFFLHCVINYFLYSSPLLFNLEILMILTIMHYTQIGHINSIYGILFIVLLIALISWRYDSSFWNRLKSLSPDSFKSPA